MLRLAAPALGLAGLACASAETVPAPGHLLLFVDTDAPVPTSSAGEDTPAALFDTLRIEVVRPGEDVPCATRSREFAADDELFRAGASFTIRTDVAGERVRVRVRLFRSASSLENEIRADSTIEVVAELPARPKDGARELTVFLPTDAVGRPIGSLDAPVAPDHGRPKKPRVGSWPGARRIGCAEPSGPGEVCIPGGAFWMGNPLTANSIADNASDCQRLVVLAPFYLDVREVDVAEMRASGLGASSKNVFPYNPVTSTKDDSNWCTFTAAPGARDAMPVNCVTWAAARTYCQTIRAGDLPSQAELEYVAGGFASNLYVWGHDEPDCADAVWGRAGVGFLSALDGDCRPDDVGGPVPHPTDDAGWKQPPRARDWVPTPAGPVFDLAGSLTEWARDRFSRQDEPCWLVEATNVFVDPVCDTSGVGSERRTAYGGSWNDNTAFLRAAFRRPAAPDIRNSGLGFRCSRPATPAP